MGQAVLDRNSIATNYLENNHQATEKRYKLFVCVWVIATLFHLANFRSFAQEFHYFLFTAAAIFLALKPASIGRLLIFIGFQFYEVFNDMPSGSNHWVFAAFVNLTIVMALLLQVLQKRSFKIDRAQLLKTFAPVVRIELLILYFFVVFHKLNSGFFSTALSCASEFYIAQNAYSLLPATPEIIALNAYLTIIVEALIPLMLFFRLTRNWGLLLGLVFHCIIAYNPINGFYDFSSLIFALYFLFTSYSFSNRLYSLYQSARKKKQLLKARFSQFSVLKVCMIGLVFLGAMAVVHLLTSKVEDYFRYIFWTAFSLAFIGIFMAVMFSRRKEPGPLKNAFKVYHPVLLIIPVLVFLNGTSPYLGLKTETSFAMFSNLRTEGGISNHYLVPASAQLFDFQKDLVEITASSDEELQKYADENKLIVYAFFQRLVTYNRPETVSYIRNGQPQTFVLANAGANHELLQKQPYWFRKFIQFRAISKTEPQPCVH